MRLTRSGRKAATGVIAALVATVVVSIVLVRFTSGEEADEVPGGEARVAPDSCIRPPKLKSRRGVTLQPDALRAFRKAERMLGASIEVVSSYRTCAEQAVACERICGDPGGCPGTCIEPGLSYHQLGKAIDVSQAALDTPGVVAALRRAGWCQSVPRTDPGHFSFDGCH